MIALYDLSVAPASWDFATWLVIAKMEADVRGEPLEVAIKPGPAGGFRDDGLPGSDAFKRIMRDREMPQLITLIGGTLVEATDGERFPYLSGEVVARYRRGQPVAKFRLPMDRRVPDVTFTIRNADHWPERNGNGPAWARFMASFLGPPVKTVPEHASVKERAELYGAASMNFFVSNGPMTLCIYSDAPYMIFKPIGPPSFPAGTPWWWTNMCGLPPGEQWPWANDAQRMVWADDDEQSLFDAWLAYQFGDEAIFGEA